MHSYPTPTEHWPGTPAKNTAIRRTVKNTRPGRKIAMPAFLQPVVLVAAAKPFGVPAITADVKPYAGLPKPAAHLQEAAVCFVQPDTPPPQPTGSLQGIARLAVLYLYSIYKWLARAGPLLHFLQAPQKHYRQNSL